jgi:hypothetical protein
MDAAAKTIRKDALLDMFPPEAGTGRKTSLGEFLIPESFRSEQN